jgi:LacI family transcriptional regulator
MIDLYWPLVHHHQIFAGIERYSSECGRWQCRLTPFPQLERKSGRRVAPFDGIVGRITPAAAKYARAAGVPVVNTMLHGRVPGVPSVLHNPEQSARMAAEHLMARGLRNFAYIGQARDEGSRRQLAAMRAVLKEAGYTCSHRFASRTYGSEENEWKSLQRKLDEVISGWTTPIGVFVGHDLLCRHLAAACVYRGLAVPFDVALVGCYNEPVICGAKPTISSVDFGFERIGYHAAELLDSLMDGGPAPAEPIYLPPTELVPRQSSDVVSVDNPTVSKAMRYIMERSHKVMGVKDVARHVGTTQWTLLRLFHQYLGQTIEQFISHIRHERVRRVLIGTDEPLKIVARESGFRDEAELCRVFRRLEGMTPGEFRDGRAGP